MSIEDRNGDLHNEKTGQYESKGKALSNLTDEQKKKLLKTLKFFAKKKLADANSRITNETAQINIPKQILGFGKGREKTQHHQNHIIELGYKDEKQYQKGAIEFWNRKDVETYFSQSTQRYYKYDRKTGMFLSVDTKGILKTFFELGDKKFKNKKLQEGLYELKS